VNAHKVVSTRWFRSVAPRSIGISGSAVVRDRRVSSPVVENYTQGNHEPLQCYSAPTDLSSSRLELLGMPSKRAFEARVYTNPTLLAGLVCSVLEEYAAGTLPASMPTEQISLYFRSL